MTQYTKPQLSLFLCRLIVMDRLERKYLTAQNLEVESSIHANQDFFGMNTCVLCAQVWQMVTVNVDSHYHVHQ